MRGVVNMETMLPTLTMRQKKEKNICRAVGDSIWSPPKALTDGLMPPKPMESSSSASPVIHQ